jgi:two-component system sensor histidine kinase EvgS
LTIVLLAVLAVVSWIQPSVPSPLPPEDRFQLDPGERAWLDGHRSVRVGIDPGWAPVEFVDRRGMPQGISVAYLQRLEQTLGLKFELIPIRSWAQAMEQLSDGDLDMLPSVDRIAARRGGLLLTPPYVRFPAAIFSAADVAYLDGVGALRGRTVAVIEDDAVHDWLLHSAPEIDLLPVADTREALRRLRTGDAFAFVGNLVTTSYYIGRTGGGRIRVAGETSFEYTLAMGVRDDHQVLAWLLQTGLDAIPQSEQDAIFHEWNTVRYSHRVDRRLLWQVLIGAALMIAVFLAWNRSLAAEVARRRRAEAELREAKEVAEQASRAKDSFLANISHELRTPLNLVLGFASLLRRGARNERERHWLDGISSAGRTLSTLIDDLLDLSRIEAGRLPLSPAPTDPRVLLEEVEAMFAQPAADKGLGLSVEIDPEVPALLVLDERRLRQILVNLVGNALKYTDAGRIRLHAEAERVGPDRVGLRIAVHDTGRGIDLRDQPSLFEPFDQGALVTAAGGAGLGLAISRRLARLLGGDIEVSSTPGHGSTFSVVLNDVITAPPPVEVLPRPVPRGEHVRLPAARVLIVDDRTDNRDLLRHFLHGQPLEIIEAGDGAAALELARVRHPDLILMDLAMPGMDGLSATRQLRQWPQTAAVPILAVTAAAVRDNEHKLREAFDAVLRKPFTREELLGHLARWLAGGVAADDHAAADAPPQPARPLALPSALRERLCALRPPCASINAIQDFAGELLRQADDAGDAALWRAAEELRRAAERFDLQLLVRRLVALRQRAGCDDLANGPA